MTTTTHAIEASPASGAGSSWVPGGRMLRAELLKLIRRRGLMIATVALTVGALIAYYAVAAGLHAASPGQYGPAGGAHSLTHIVFLLAELGAVAAILLGASVGAADVTSGVFRNLVTTGRSRVALYLARIPAGLGVTVAIIAVAYALGAACSVLFAGTLPTAPAHLIIAGGAWLLVNAAVAFLLGLGLSSLIGSQSTTTAVLLALTIVVTPLVASISALPDIRQALPGIALYQLQPSGLDGIGVQGLTMTTTSIAVVLGAWAVLAMAAGIWRTVTRDC
ncbi:MAG TPA: ABC transporter permease [Streptosporangiaceae bacterium]|jgi:ABC-type transport system involved in multi-copper enzyme maturation permease subunit